ncbi:hypothetical protein ciss_11380 [Carboxydothermus islandicus]|uniref:Uncharacterized protein n=1 Tax=Carboxydothermus islandicus TaxID=661089 RepID=A0A1L8D1Y5_9THEO|nr:hypothetical protein [Carboxydothermus islandicus]GAV25205.1 hypothetical protein ciss_11380 [Carboxydothermus islandicus]
MTENNSVKNTFKNLPPGVCIPWEEKLKDLGEIKGDVNTIKNEWDKLEVFTYLYIWYWVHR